MKLPPEVELPVIGTTVSPELVVRSDVARQMADLGASFEARPIVFTPAREAGWVQAVPKAFVSASAGSLVAPIVPCATCGGWGRLHDGKISIIDPRKSGDVPHFAGIVGVPSARLISSWLLVLFRSWIPDYEAEEVGLK